MQARARDSFSAKAKIKTLHAASVDVNEKTLFFTAIHKKSLI